MARLFAISDIHVDLKANQEWIAAIDSTSFLHDVLIVAGDVTERTSLLLETLAELKQKFNRVFFCCGNHDVWVGSSDPEGLDSVAKQESVLEQLRALGVETEPALVDGRFWVAPLDSWHSFHENGPNDPGGLSYAKLVMWRDFEKCSWPVSLVGAASTTGRVEAPDVFDHAAKLAESRAVARAMLERNEAKLERLAVLQAVRGLPVVTFSHFLPRPDLLRNPDQLRFRELVAVSVCEGLDEQIRKVRSKVHVFGHTHVRTNRLIDGCTYVQNPLGYPSESATYCPRPANIRAFEIEL